MRRIKVVGGTMLSVFWLFVPGIVVPETVHIVATDETQAIPSTGDAADDVSIWVHPTNPALSTIIGTDKKAGLAVYALDGHEIQFLHVGKPNNVDIRYNFLLAGMTVDLLGFSNRADDSIGLYTVNPTTRQLVDIAARPIATGVPVYGFCMYHSPVDGTHYAFVTSTDGDVQQWRLFAQATGRVDAALVRSFNIGWITEGCVADDDHAVLYIADEEMGIWKYGAEPGAGDSRVLVDAIRPGGPLQADIEGLTLYYANQGEGYLIASSQGSDAFVVYERTGTNRYVATFQIAESEKVDGVTRTDGIDVISAALGRTFPMGVFIAQDDRNDAGNQNFKLVPWHVIAEAVTPRLRVAMDWHPRQRHVPKHPHTPDAE
jgi:3-phytase